MRTIKRLAKDQVPEQFSMRLHENLAYRAGYNAAATVGNAYITKEMRKIAKERELLERKLGYIRNHIAIGQYDDALNKIDKLI